MYLRKLTLTNMRAFRNAEFDFLGDKGVYLIVGVNGVGKSTALEALRVALTQLLPRFITTGVPVVNFDEEAITIGTKFLNMSLTGTVSEVEFSYTLDYKPEVAVPNQRPVGVRAPRKGASRLAKVEYLTSNTRDSVRDAAYSTPNVESFYLGESNAVALTSSTDIANNQQKRLNDLQQNIQQNASYPLVVYYSPRRSLFNNKAPGMLKKQLPAYYESLEVERVFSIKVFADWWRSRRDIAVETKNESEAAKISQLFKRVVTTFLDNCQDIQIAPDGDERHLLIMKDGYQLSVKQLSDGERSVLTLVLDLARRLYLANPGLEDSIGNGQAIVLIDELDLHLHPSWQRDIVQRLEEIFPKCQFICSTHSPQIIGEVIPEKISLVLPEQLALKIRNRSEETKDSLLNRNQVFSLIQALGMDSNWILTHVMQTPERDKDTIELIQEMFDLLARRDYKNVPTAIEAVEARTSGATTDTIRAKATLERVKIIGR